MSLENFIKPKSSNQVFFQKDNLLKLVLDFCTIEEILALSLVNKKFYSITKFFDYKFMQAFSQLYFSDYENYS